MPPALHLAFFADDFTGATDALNALAQAGLRARLFLDPPSPAQCAGLDAVGVAGLTRSLPPAEMAATLRPALTALRDLGPRHVFYKVCSTFDSSPEVGSIGCAIETGRAVFGGAVVPLLVAAPALGRYSAFGHLFARYGIGSTSPIFRLDRHPAASAHPVTPMTESDLRRHLGRQTRLPIGLVELPTVELGVERTLADLRAQVAAGAAIVLFDAVNEAHIATIGQALARLAGEQSPLFSIGSSGLGTALASLGRAPAAPTDATTVPAVAPDPLLVISGSCSPVTAGQIEAALAAGFVGVNLDVATPETPATRHGIAAALRSGRSVIAYTARGSAGPVLAPARELGPALGRLAREVIAVTGVQRLVIAGGDTSSYAARALGVESVAWHAPLAPGSPWCRVRAPGSPADGRLLNLKGGQVGAPDYFLAARG